MDFGPSHKIVRRNETLPLWLNGIEMGMLWSTLLGPARGYVISTVVVFRRCQQITLLKNELSVPLRLFQVYFEICRVQKNFWM